MTTKKNNLLSERNAFRPFYYPFAYDAWLAHEKSHWIMTEVPMIEDVKDWKRRLSKEEKYFLTNIFRFFTQGDIDVASGYVQHYLPYFKAPEVRMMLLGFAAREAVHVAAYSHLIETLGMPESTYNEFLQYQEMRNKHEYLLKIGDRPVTKDSIALQLAAFSAFTEGMQLFSSFIMLLNFPRHGLMKGMGQIISWSIVDETMHCESMIRLFRTFIEEHPEIWDDKLKEGIYAVAEKMVELEDQFIDLSYKMGEMPDLTAKDVKQYIRYIADRRLISMSMKGIFKVKKNPLVWIEGMINSPGHTNFFEQRSTDYAKGAMSGSWSEVWGEDVEIDK